MIPVTKPYLPPIEKYKQYVDKIYDSGILTNRGPLLRSLEERLAEHLGVKHVICVANGSIALQVAYKALGLKGDVITTPFSFAATSSTLLWEHLNPVFCDIDIDSFNLDPDLIEKHLTKNTSAILPVHVFGNPCDVENIQRIAQKHSLKVIYDAAHAFGVDYKDESILKHGDVSTLSFHATKLFHTVEGGAIVTESDDVANKVRELINFGIIGPDLINGIGTNAKMNEFEAAMGLCVLDDISDIASSRKNVINKYKSGLKDHVRFQKINKHSSSLSSYMPIVFDSEDKLITAKTKLERLNIYPRRYFYPSLDEVYSSSKPAINSTQLSKRILCLPLMHNLSEENIKKTIKAIKEL